MQTPEQQYDAFKTAVINDNKDLALSLITIELASYINTESGYTALILACEKNISDVALALIKTGKSNPSNFDENGNTALIWACVESNTTVALALIETLQSNPSNYNKFGYTALTYACSNKMTEVALALIATEQSNPSQVSKNGSTALMFACLNKLQNVALALIETRQSNPGNIDNNGNTALILACENNMPEVALALIKTGESNPSNIDNNGNTALILACENNMPEVALALIETSQSNPELISNSGKTAHINATRHNMTKVVTKIETILNELNIRISNSIIYDIFSGTDVTVNNFLNDNDFQEKQPFIIEEMNGRYAGNYKEGNYNNKEYEPFYECKKPYSEANKKPKSPIYIKLYGARGQILLCKKPKWFDDIGTSIKIVKAKKMGFLEQIVSHSSLDKRLVSADHCNLETPIAYYVLFKTELTGVPLLSQNAGTKKTKNKKTRRNKRKTNKYKTKNTINMYINK